MNISFDILNDPTLLTEFCAQVGYVAETTDENGIVTPNPVSEADFATQFLQDSVASYIKTYEINNAIEQAMVDATDSFESNKTVQAVKITQTLNVK